jgi:hypothetical protein
MAFETALDTAWKSGNVHARERDINAGNPNPIIVRLERLRRDRDFIAGELIRKQVQKHPT